MKVMESGGGPEWLPAGDDVVLPFQTERSSASGRVVRLGAVVDSILKRHDYPESVSRVLGEAVALTAMLGSTLKFEGNFILQTKTDGPLDLLVVDYRAPGELRGYARFDKERVAELEAAGGAEPGILLGHGHLAMTVDRGPEMDRYQGVVALDGGDLNEAADTYFRQSEQLPTFIRVAVARHFGPGGEGASGWSWRAGGLMVQTLTREGGHDSDSEELEPLLGEGDEDWNRVRYLAETVEDHELLDPTLAPERLLYRLFHEETVRAYRPNPLEVYCRCSRERVAALLEGFSGPDLADMVEDGMIRVTCEFCNRRYDFDAADFAGDEEGGTASG